MLFRPATWRGLLFPITAQIQNPNWGWREPFLPEQSGAWATFPALAEFFAE
jgi:hypothetical protein